MLQSIASEAKFGSKPLKPKRMHHLSDAMMRTKPIPPVSAMPMGGFASGAAEMAITATHRALRILARIAGAGALAVIAGIVLGAVATGGGLVQLIVTFFAAVALWIPAFMLLTGIHRWRTRRQQSAHRREREYILSRTGGSSWERLAHHSGEHRQRLLALYRELTSTHQSLPPQSLDPDVHECRILIEKRIPQLIDSRLDSLPAEPNQRSAAIGDLLDLVERFADDCRAREERLLQTRQDDHDIVRRRIEGHIARDPPA